ncbi:acetyl-CoA carboxylase biotin carboxylase subunit [Solihabitans fulvus]|uniref:biotin carboxylase n=1 Tax=Solihabitans fulvus TaxID=1892852 RepID=A0A5B2WL46_9PSEU|nr:acetyl-CoA carboxylase biotin carboxylase subunit [Solihabitans fulvus]KAA2251226.1 acetyl-CoA carboxylase biotin carboxylase subunit [Solihabitans fulvus]
MFSTVLIANRGEIAVRVARTCRELGIRTVAVVSTSDLDSAVTRIADRTVHIGPGQARRSYRNASAIIEAALQTGAQAIHPGYGFLSEDPDFAEICDLYGITFIGPPARVIADLGDKSRARKLMDDAGLPMLPGSKSAVDNVVLAKEIADDIGYPVIIKAAAGGGGRGMSVVRSAAEFADAFRTARAQAQAVFGDARVYVERYLESARHVEVQILADQHGNAVHLGERDCSVQRRHQKLVEESPAPNLERELAARMGRAAVQGALSVGYVGAGTVEFLVDERGEFYFMEVNCRIQVEHPVTEMVTGIDLVREQLAVASGQRLSLRQEDIRPNGCSIEVRVNAEDPEREFLPTPGRLTEFTVPTGPFTRVDTHAFPGWVVSPDYDPLLAKVIVWAPDRNQALARMERALGEMRVSGDAVESTVPFLREVLAQPLFRDGKHTTALVDDLLAKDRS